MFVLRKLNLTWIKAIIVGSLCSALLSGCMAFSFPNTAYASSVTDADQAITLLSKTTPSKTKALSSKAAKAYAGYLATHQVAGFALRKISGKTKALIVTDSFMQDTRKSTHATVLLYKNGKVKKLGKIQSGTSYNPIRYCKGALTAQSRHSHHYVAIANIAGKKLYNQQFYMYTRCVESETSWYREYGLSSSYGLNGKTQVTGKDAIDLYYSIAPKFGKLSNINGGKALKFIKNTNKNRTKYLATK